MGSNTFTFEACLIRGRNEREVEVDVTYSLSGDDIEIISVKRNGAEFQTSREEDNKLYDWACDRVDGDIDEWSAEFAEYRAEMRRDERMLGEAA